MKESSRFIPLPRDGARAYVLAARILKRKLGAGAPDASILIRLELSNRDPQMIADEYLEAHRARLNTSLAVARAAKEICPAQ